MEFKRYTRRNTQVEGIQMVSVNVIENNKLIQALLTALRDKNTPVNTFREYLRKIGMAITVEASQDFEIEEISVETPMNAKAKGVQLKEDIVVIAILRAGLAMAEGVTAVLPDILLGFIGAKRQEAKGTVSSEVHYISVPDLTGKTVIIVDPMLATGSTLSKVLEKIDLKKAKKIMILSVIATEDGIYRLTEINPNIIIYTAALDPELDENAFIIPGLGDAGERAYGW